VFIFQHNFTKGHGSNETNKTSRWFDTHDVQPRDIFSPSFFDLMSHLLIHIVHEMKYICPMFLHHVYPFERFMTIPKMYVCN
jgi:hypothetical protein